MTDDRSHARRPFLARLALPLALPLVFVAFGCAGGAPRLNVTSLENGQTYQQRFAKAYAGRGDNGDFEVVLVKDAPNGSSPGVRQVMHVRMLWKPMKGTKLDHPSATNATIDWYVLGAPGTQGGTPSDMIAYAGAGFVTVKRAGNTATVDIRNATLRPTTRQGALADPIGPAKLAGTAVARVGRREHVRELLAQVRNVTAHARAQATRQREASSRAPIEP